MLTLDDINSLAEQSKAVITIPDDYAEHRCRWVCDPKYAGMAMWWGKPQPYYKFLYLIAKQYHGGVALEIGTHSGIGFSCLSAGAKASNNKNSWTIGIDMANHGAALEVSTKYDNCVFINGISTNVVSQVEDICTINKTKIKIMFIDATHTLSWVNAEISAYKHLFDEQVVIIMDDCMHADNNTKLPECFSCLPGQKLLFPELHTDNCIGVALSSSVEFATWNPLITPSELTL